MLSQCRSSPHAVCRRRLWCLWPLPWDHLGLSPVVAPACLRSGR